MAAVSIAEMNVSMSKLIGEGLNDVDFSAPLAGAAVLFVRIR
jgi:hypothetical protein